MTEYLLACSLHIESGFHRFRQKLTDPQINLENRYRGRMQNDNVSASVLVFLLSVCMFMCVSSYTHRYLDACVYVYACFYTYDIYIYIYIHICKCINRFSI